MGRKKRMPLAVQRRIRETLEEEELRKHGYRMDAGEASRRRALAKSVREDGGLTVFRRLNLLQLWQRDRDPRLASIAHSDKEWVKATYMGTQQW